MECLVLCGVLLVGLLGYRQVELSAKVLVIMGGLADLIVMIFDDRNLGLRLLVYRHRGNHDLWRRGQRPRSYHPTLNLCRSTLDRCFQNYR